MFSTLLFISRSRGCGRGCDNCYELVVLHYRAADNREAEGQIAAPDTVHTALASTAPPASIGVARPAIPELELSVG